MLCWKVLGNPIEQQKCVLWPAQHQQKRKELGIDHPCLPKWSKSAQLAGVRTARERDIVDMAFAKEYVDMGAACSDDVKTNLILDLSQSAGRNWSRRVRSLVKASRLYSFSHDRVIYAHEHMRLLGMVIPPATLSQFSPHALRELAGEMFPAPCIGLLEVSLLLHVL